MIPLFTEDLSGWPDLKEHHTWLRLEVNIVVNIEAPYKNPFFRGLARRQLNSEG